MSNRLAACLVLGMLVIAPSFSTAEEARLVAEGRRLATGLCAKCHMNEGQGEKQGPMGIPGFEAVANRPGQSFQDVVEWLKSVPPMMPDHKLATNEIDTLAAFIMSLRRPRRAFDYWQPDWMVRELWGPGRMPKGLMIRLLRHTTYMQYGVPKSYFGASSTVSAKTAKSIKAGAALYDRHCASCHGKNGMGGGEPGRALSPSPALLAYMIRRPISVDEYLLWAIADGGSQFGSTMPAFRDMLPREDIWRIVAFMRARFPGINKRPKQ
ncbi:MAG: c-type cytochrome [Hyphomicrobiaceae bacterium]